MDFERKCLFVFLIKIYPSRRSVKGIIHTFFKCVYYRVYSMAEIIPH